MTPTTTPRINPNFLLECHPQTLKDHFYALNLSEPAAQPPLPASQTPPVRPILKTVFQRLAKMRFVGRSHLIKFLYKKQLRQCKHRTLSNYCVSISALLRYITRLGKTCIDQIEHVNLEGFVEYEQDRGLKPATLHLRLTNFYCFARYLVDQGILPQDRFERKIRIKVPDALPRAMDPIDVKRLLAVIDDVRDRAMILVLLRTGLRIGELLQLTMNDVRLAENKILIWEGEKNATGRTVCLSQDARDALCQWLYCRNPEIANIFYGRGRHSLAYTASSLMLQKYLKKAGLEGRRYTLHSLRHTFATDLLNAGMRIECLQQLLGHSSLQMTLRYARLSDQTREQEYFKAMALIEGEVTDGFNPFDYPLPPPPEA
jgi:integrase/recombinase XerD